MIHARINFEIIRNPHKKKSFRVTSLLVKKKVYKLKIMVFAAFIYSLICGYYLNYKDSSSSL